MTKTHVTWSGWNGDTLVFESSDDGQTTVFAQVGHEFNGSFFLCHRCLAASACRRVGAVSSS